MNLIGWEYTELKNIADLYQGSGFPKHLQGKKTGDLGFYKVADISKAILDGRDYLYEANHYISFSERKKIRATPLPKDSIIFAKVGEAVRLNRRGMLPNIALADNNIMAVKALNGILDRYLLYFLKIVRLDEISRATTVPSVRKSDIERLKVPVPPTNEQKRIVSRIEELFSQIDEGERALKRVQKLVERYRQSVLKAAVTGELTREWREQHAGELETGESLLARILKARREAWEKAELEKMADKGQTPKNDDWKKKYKEPLPPDVGELPELPEGWVWASPVQLEGFMPNALTIGPFGSNLKVSDYTTTGVPLIFVRHIRSQNFKGENPKFVSTDKAEELSSHITKSGDVLITKMGDPPGDACVYPQNSPDAVITADCIKWTIAPLLPAPEFFAIFVNSHLGSQQIANITKGVAQQKVSLARFRQIAVALPPAVEQTEISQIVERENQNISKTVASIIDQSRLSSALRQCILKAAFSGQLTSQDSNDEPASELLKRIAAERAAAEIEAKRNPKKKATV